MPAATPAIAAATPDRLIAAATELFAERGFHGTSIRDIAERAGANVAAGHYHYGSKNELYLQVLRAQFAYVRAMFERRGAAPSRQALQRASRRQLASLLETRIAAMVDFLLEPPLQPHGALMLREMADPTEALPIVVAEFITPQTREMEAIVARLIPRCGRAAVRSAVLSIVGQILFYRVTLSALLLLDEHASSRHFRKRIARHVAEFSLGGLTRVAASSRRRYRGR